MSLASIPSSNVTPLTTSSTGSTGSNCFGWAAYASGASPAEGDPAGRTFIQDMKLSLVSGTIVAGDLAIWSYIGNIGGLDPETSANPAFKLAGVPAHAAIYVLSDAAGNSYFLNRATMNAPVTLSTGGMIQDLYEQMSRDREGPYTWPGITPGPKFYR